MEKVIQIFIYGILSGGIYGAIAISLTMIYGVLKLVNFAHGEFLMVSMYLSYWLFKLFSIDPYVGSIIVIIAMYCFGTLIFKIFINTVLYEPNVVQIFTTLGLSLILQNGALLLFKADYRYIHTSYSLLSIKIGHMMIGIPNLITFSLAMIASILLFLFLQKTDLGKAVRAIAQNDNAAKLVGINVRKTYLFTYTLSLVIVGLAGATLVPIYSTYPLVGQSFISPVFVAVVLGGLGNVIGAALGGIIIGLVQSFTAYYIGPELQHIAYFLLFLLILTIRPLGIMGKVEEIV